MSGTRHKSSETGAGEITLLTPVTETDRTLTYPDADGELVRSATPGGMPMAGNTEIVASGGNSDGDWVRMAEGTQYAFFMDGVPGVAETAGQRSWTYPVSFLDTPVVNGNPVWTDVSISRTVNVKDPSSTSVQYGITNSSDSYTTVIAALTAIGRWK